MSRPEFYEVHLESSPDAVALCRCCVAVLVTEGTVAGDPTMPAISAEDVWKVRPCWWAVPCEIHEQLRRFEEKRSLLPAPPKRIGEVVQ